MNDSARVGVHESRTDIPNDRPSVSAIKSMCLRAFQRSAQESTLEQFHRVKGRIFVVVDFEYFDDIRMRKCLRAVKLAPQVCNEFWTLAHGVIQDLERYVPIFLWKIETKPVQRLEDCAHPASAEHAL